MRALNSLVLAVSNRPSTVSMITSSILHKFVLRVASALYEKIGQKITLTFFDRRGRLTELDNEGCRISRIEAPHDDDDITCYLNDKKIDIQCFKIGNWREMMIYNLWNYGNSIDWKN